MRNVSPQMHEGARMQEYLKQSGGGLCVWTTKSAQGPMASIVLDDMSSVSAVIYAATLAVSLERLTSFLTAASGLPPDDFAKALEDAKKMVVSAYPVVQHGGLRGTP